MKKWFTLLLALLLVMGVVSASAQTVSCSDGGFSLTLPDSFGKISTKKDDPELKLHYNDGSIDMCVYVSFSGNSTIDFQVNSSSSSVTFSGKKMNCEYNTDNDHPCVIYSWSSSGNAINIYFVWYGEDAAAQEVIDSIMSSITFN